MLQNVTYELYMGSEVTKYYIMIFRIFINYYFYLKLS